MTALLLLSLLAGLATVPCHQDSCTIAGRIVDPRGEPVPDAQIRLSSSGPWAAEPAPDVEDRLGRRSPGYLGSSDAGGRFELTVPVPTAAWVTLQAIPDAHHMLAQVELGLESGVLPLAPGERDVGDVVVRDAGVVFGRVVDADGDGIAGALVRPRPGATGSAYFPHVLAREDGSFRLGHLPVGTFALKCRARGHRSRDDFVVTVARGAEHGPVVLELARGPRFKGRVIDAEGGPVSGVPIPGQTGEPCEPLRTDAEGRFDVRLERTDTHRIELDVHGFEKTSVAFVPGADEVEIVLHRAQGVRLEVRDARTGRALERFGARSTDPEWPERCPLKPRDHPGGVAVVPVRPGEAWWQVDAPGYAPAEGPFDPASDTAIDVALVPGSRLTGVVEVDGVPVRAVVHLALDDTSEAPDPCPDFPSWWWTQTDQADLTGFTGRMRRTAADEHGHFELVDLAAGTYRLLGEDAVGRFVDLRQLEIPADATLDLGRLPLARGARIHGSVTVDGVPTAGVEVVLQSPFGPYAATTTTDAAGRYSILEVHPGFYHVAFARAPRRSWRECRVTGTETVQVDGEL